MRKPAITFPSQKVKIGWTQGNFLYVVCCKFSDGTWGFADFFGYTTQVSIPYTARKKTDAIAMRDMILDHIKMHPELYWEGWNNKNKFTIMKIGA